MKKMRLAVSMLCICFMFGIGAQTVFADEQGGVAINEENFPDAKIRKRVKENMFNQKHDDFLTWEEIENATGLEISTEDTMEGGDWDITGIEKLKNLKRVVIRLQAVQKGKELTGRKIKGTFRNNKKLEEVTLDAEGRKVSWNEIESLLPLKQIKILRIENVDIQQIFLSKASELQSLTIRNCLSLKKLDLTKNMKLKEVSVLFGYSCALRDCTTGKIGRTPFFLWSENSCKIRFPKNNQIKKLNYFTKDKELDISRCKKLREAHISKDIRLRTLRQWYKKNKRKLVVYAQGFRQKKLNVRKKKNAVLLKATKWEDVNKGYYCDEEESS